MPGLAMCRRAEEAALGKRRCARDGSPPGPGEQQRAALKAHLGSTGAGALQANGNYRTF